MVKKTFKNGTKKDYLKMSLVLCLILEMTKQVPVSPSLLKTTLFLGSIWVIITRGIKEQSFLAV